MLSRFIKWTDRKMICDYSTVACLFHICLSKHALVVENNINAHLIHLYNALTHFLSTLKNTVWKETHAQILK